MAIAKCVFCGFEQEDFKGTYFIKNDGNVHYYCSGKCLKNNLHLRRDKKKARWTEAHKILKSNMKEAKYKIVS